jgi:anti-sigma regulatory factor (Ser/Thr protein kinase)
VAERREGIEVVEIDAPLDLDFQGVVRLIVGGIAEQADFGYEAMDDLQLAIERLLAETAGDSRVRISFELGNGGVRTRIGPLGEGSLAEALQDGDEDAGKLTLRRVLSTVVDSFGVEPASDGRIVVRLEKLGPARP